MSETHPFVRSRFRTPDGQLILQGSVDGAKAMHALLLKDDVGDGWQVLGAYRTREAAEYELAERQARSMADCLIIDCEPY